MCGHEQGMDDLQMIRQILSEGEMFLIGIGSELEKNESNTASIDEAYRTVAAYLKGKPYYAITGNTDGKLLDGTLFHTLVAAPNLEGQEEAWSRYMNWLSCTLNHRLVILELGEGFRQPQLMRWPFEKVVAYHQKAKLIRVGTSFPQVPKELKERAFSVPMDPCRFIKEVLL